MNLHSKGSGLSLVQLYVFCIAGGQCPHSAHRQLYTGSNGVGETPLQIVAKSVTLVLVATGTLVC